VPSNDIEVKGLKEVQKSLYSYSQQLGDKIVIGALRLGASLMRKEIQANAPVYKGKPRPYIIKGNLKKGFRVSKSRIYSGKTTSGTLGVFVTLKKGDGRSDPKDPFYGRFQNEGFRGRAGLKFIDKAYNSKKEAAANLIVAAASAAADSLTKKLGL
jgi:HK97 gp10 family phage protein